MKNFIILLIIIFFASCGNNKSHEENKSTFELKGKLSNTNGEQLYLDKMTSSGVIVVDTANLNENGEFSFLKAKPSLGFYRVRLTESNFAMLVLDSTQKAMLTGDARDLGNTFNVEGSPDSKLFRDVNETAKRSYQRRDSLMRSYEAYANLNKGNKTKIEEFGRQAEQEFNAEARRLNNYLLDVIKRNPASLVAIIALQQLQPELSEDEYISYYKEVDEALTKKYPDSDQTKNFHNKVEGMLQAMIGSAAPDFTFDTPDGKKLSPSSFKGKYVLLDFWASWCGPCRAESPNMVNMYKKFHPKGLEILSVSLDDNRDKWLAAIQKDKLEWNHVSDLAGWQSAAVKLYNIIGIPQTYLLDKEGKIIAKGLRAEGLEAKLGEVIK
jgi:thiol-disulfide isomerase/thioredoxin